MSLALEMQDDIAELLDDPDIGRTITIARSTAGTYNPADGSTTPATPPATITTRGLLLGYKDSLIDGALIKKGDRKLFVKLKGISYTPSESDVITAGVPYSVVGFKIVELGGTNVIFIMQVRGR